MHGNYVAYPHDGVAPAEMLVGQSGIHAGGVEWATRLGLVSGGCISFMFVLHDPTFQLLLFAHLIHTFLLRLHSYTFDQALSLLHRFITTSCNRPLHLPHASTEGHSHFTSPQLT